MSNDFTVHGNLAAKGAIITGDFGNTFPPGRRGMMIIKDGSLWVYAVMATGGLETWFPVAKLPRTYLHSQGAAAVTWVVTHNLDNANVWFQLLDDDGNIIFANRTVNSTNQFTVHLTEAMTGTCLVFASEDVDVATISASVLSIAGGIVVCNSSGITINGVQVLTSASIGIADVSGLSAALTNKVDVSSLPTNVSELTNDVGYQTAANVTAVINGVIGGASAAMDTLGELETALANESSAVAALTTVVAGKADAADLNYATIGPAAGLVDALVANATANGVVTINCSTTTYYKATLTGTITTLVLDQVPTAGPYSITLKLIQGGSGSNAVSWPAGTRWSGGGAPVLTTTVGKYDFIGLSTDDGGATWSGFVGGLNF